MSRTVTTTVYTFSELSDKAQEKALENLRDINVDCEWWDYLFEDFRTIAGILGVTVKDIYFTGFSSQGDGASFTGTYQYRKGWRKALTDHAPNDKELFEIGDALQDIQRRAFYSVSASIRHQGHYDHSGCMSIDSYGDYPFDGDAIAYQLRLLADWLYSRLESEYDFLTSEQQVKEAIEFNEYEFEEDGTLL